MATRFYFTAYAGTLAPVTPPAAGAHWEHVQGQNRKLLRVDDGVALANRAYSPDAADHLVNNDALFVQYVSDPLDAQTISGNVKAQVQCFESTAANNVFLTFEILVISNDGTTVRSTILAITRDGTEMGTSLTNRAFGSTALTSYACVLGDRICVLMGCGGTPTAATGVNGHNATYRTGTSGASSGDLPEDDSTTATTYRPWIEFSNDLSFIQLVPRSMHQFRLRRQ